MVIGKLDITVYFHITSVHVCIIPRGFSYLIDRNRLRKLTRVHFKKQDVLPGDLDKFHQGPETGVR